MSSQMFLVLALLLPAWQSQAPSTASAQPPTRLEPTDRPRARDLGLEPGVLRPGELNAITDVDGVLVGQTTIVRGDSVRTGVTAILPHSGNLYVDKVPAAVYVGNGFGKAAGFLQVEELGTLETPVVLTNTLSVSTAMRAVVDWTLEQPGNQNVRSVNAVVGETNDGFLNDIRGFHVRQQDVIAAIAGAKAGPVEEGSVGAGTGTRAFGWKGGIGTSSRRLPKPLGGFVVGALVQTNYDGVLVIDGHRVGELWGRYPFRDRLDGNAAEEPDGESPVDPEEGSCMVVVATDAPVSPRNLKRMARRAVLGLGRTGSFLSNGSGDFVVAFSTRNRALSTDSTGSTEMVGNDRMSPLFLATVEAVEEAVYNSILRATSVRGRNGSIAEAIPIDRLRILLSER